VKYKINWTEMVGYYAIVEASSPEEAQELFEDDSSGCVPEPDGSCEIEQDSIEVERYPEQDKQPSEG